MQAGKSKLKGRGWAALLCGALLGIPAAAHAQDAAALLRQAEQRHRLKSERIRATLVLQDAGGAQRSLSFESHQASDGGERERIVFLAPADLKGTALLSIDSAGGDEQWLYLPAFKKTRRIGGGELGDRFVGSDIYFEDLNRRKVEDYTHKVLRSEKLGGHDCYVIESVPRAPSVVKESPYGKTLQWLRKDTLFAVRTRYFDRQMRPLKEMEVSRASEQGGGIWKADVATITDIKRKHRTVLTIDQRQVNVAVPPGMFSRASLTAG